MPELPEVETVVRSLKPWITGKTIQSIKIKPGVKSTVQSHSPKTLERLLTGQKIHQIRRRAKYIILVLDHGFLTIHLRMTGRLIPERINPPDKKYVTAAFLFSDNTSLFFKDTRKFGRISYFSSLEPLENKLGVEPLSRAFSFDCLLSILKSRKRMIKPLLLDQKLVAGLGNIYCDEALWKAGIHPLTVSNRISRQKVKRLHQAIKSTLRSSIRHNGTTFQAFFFGSEESGSFFSKLKVFGREGLPCPQCKSSILKIRVAQRGTHICPRCQRVPVNRT
jgi:formamidopyrimidine-DNA glycosylase